MASISETLNDSSSDISVSDANVDTSQHSDSDSETESASPSVLTELRSQTERNHLVQSR